MSQPNYTLAHLSGTDFEILCESQEQQDRIRDILIAGGAEMRNLCEDKFYKMPVVCIDAYPSPVFTNWWIVKASTARQIPPADFIKQNT